MPKVELTFLGTGTSSGVPMVGCDCGVCRSRDPHDRRLRTSALVRTSGMTLVIDCGMDFRYQMLRENIRDIDAVLLTHPHIDHIGGLDDLRAFNYFKQGPCDIYCNSLTEATVRHMFSYAFSDHPYPGVPDLQLHTIGNSEFSVGDVRIMPIEGLHSRMQVFGYRIGNLAYITDMNSISEAEIEKIKGCKVLVINALRRRPHLSHFSLDQALEISSKVEARTTYLTHLSHQMGKYSDIEQLLPEGVHCAYDGLKIETE